MAGTLLTWSGIDDTSRVDRACITFRGTSMQAIGGASSGWFSSSWQLDVGPGWVTRSLRVTTHGFGWSRSLELERSASGQWSAMSTSQGEADLPAPGLNDPGTLDGAIDCDLGLCPVTNTMPIRRLGLLEREVGETHLIMAWVEVPSLRVIRSDQLYSSPPPTSGLNQVRYESYSRDFNAQLTVDHDGLVIDYPTLAQRL